MKDMKKILTIFFLIFIATSYCDVEEDDWESPACDWFQFSIDEPTADDTWLTSDVTVNLSGELHIPETPVLPPCINASDVVKVTWYNAATDQSGAGDTMTYERQDWGWHICVEYWYASGIPLVSGENRITVSIKDFNDCTRVDDTITVTRM